MSKVILAIWVARGARDRVHWLGFYFLLLVLDVKLYQLSDVLGEHCLQDQKIARLLFQLSCISHGVKLIFVFLINILVFESK